MERRPPRKERKQQPGRAGDEAPPEEQPGANAASAVSVATTLHVVIIGGGVAGVTAAEELLRMMPEGGIKITLITAAPMLKEIGKVVQVAKTLEEIEVVERDAADYSARHEHVNVVLGRVRQLDPQAKCVILEDGSRHVYDKCLVCSGARPQLVCEGHPNVVGIRDTESVEHLSRRLASAQRVAVVGNGGIALEIVHAVRSCEVLWVVKDEYIGNTFFDASASSFILPELRKGREIRTVPRGQPLPPSSSTPASTRPQGTKRPRVRSQEGGSAEPAQQQQPPHGGYGGALGPDWLKIMGLAHDLRRDSERHHRYDGHHDSSSQAAAKGASQQEQQPGASGDGAPGGQGQGQQQGGSGPSTAEGAGVLTIAFGREVQALSEQGPAAAEAGGRSSPAAPAWPLYVTMTGGETWGCDFVVSATGVVPVVDFLGPEFERGADGGVRVNQHMQTTGGSPDVYAAGDCCSMTWPESDVWFQLRLWGQARAMAAYAARCMLGQVDELGSGFAFELFAHMTRFFGYKVVLLGCFNAQLLKDEAQRQLVREVIVKGDGSVEAKALDGAEPVDGEPVTSSVASPGDGAAAPPPVEILTRVTPGHEYVKLVVVGGRVKGAMLIGETDLEETFENLILNQLDVSQYGEALLDPDVDIEDYFD